MALYSIILSAILLTFSLPGACMSIPSLNPFKKEVVLMSPLKGVLTNGGEPMANTELEVLIVMPGGEERTYKHSTNDKGEFDLPVIKDTMMLGPMTEFVVSQFVSVVTDTGKEKIWSAGKREPGLYAEHYPPGETMGLSCELSNEEQTHRELAGYIMTKCIWKEIRRI